MSGRPETTTKQEPRASCVALGSSGGPSAVWAKCVINVRPSECRRVPGLGQLPGPSWSALSRLCDGRLGLGA